MATGTTLITRALRMLGVLPVGSTANTTQLAEGLERYNALIDSWCNPQLMVYATVESTLTMVVSQQSYTIGVGGDLNITRPVKLDDAFMRMSGVDTYVRPIGQEEWDAIESKSSVSSPLVECAFYNPTMASSQGTLQVYPIPNATNELHLIYRIALTNLAAVGDTVLLPPGWDRMIASNLAMELAPDYGKEPSAALVKVATDSMASVKRINNRPMKLTSELAKIMPNRRGASRILYGP